MHRTILLLLIAATSFGMLAPDAMAQDASTYTVKEGDTLYRISVNNEISVERLKALNNLDDNTIYPGQTLRVGAAPGEAPADGIGGTEDALPAPATPSATPTPSTSATPPARAPESASTSSGPTPASAYYVTQAGDTFYSLAARFGISVESLFAVNDRRTAPLVPGDTLRLPAGEPLTFRTETPLTPRNSGRVTIYPNTYIGRLTASGTPYDPGDFSVSHRSLPLGIIVLLTNTETGRRTFARVIDRGPSQGSYLMDVSAAVARALGVTAGDSPAIALYLVEE